MSLKILTVDDSKAVRMIVKKTFKSYDCEIIEGSNGLEGLALASKEEPDIVLLDVTMPVMDGVEMLTKLKGDNKLKHIPVIMLTAEAGRGSVMKIAKIGIRDYIVKPFKEEVLIEKVGRIIDLRPAESGPKQAKSIHDKVEIVLVEDKPAIIEQINKGLAHMPWSIHGFSSAGETIDAIQKLKVDLIVISLSLPDEQAFSLFRMLRADPKSKYTPVFGLSVKTDIENQQKAQQVGFTSTITKPIDFHDMEEKIAKAINLDTSERYFNFDEDYLVIHFPPKPSPSMLAEVQAYLKSKISDAVDKGFAKVIFDNSALERADMELIRLLLEAKEICSDLTLNLILVGNDKVISECKAYEETRSWTFFPSLEAAKGSPVSA